LGRSLAEDTSWTQTAPEPQLPPHRGAHDQEQPDRPPGSARRAGAGGRDPGDRRAVAGGGLANGAGSDYDARRLAVGGQIVVVTVNYRLGALGFLGLGALPGSGALGLQDQQAALGWVRRNVANFGGDPARVTLAGESGGAQGICAQLTSPGAAGLFDRVIIQSNPCVRPGLHQSPFPPLLNLPVWQSPAEADAKAMALADTAGCAGTGTPPGAVVACLRGLPGTELVAIPFLTIPAYGNPVLPELPDQVLSSGRFHQVPVLEGITRDEGPFFAALLTSGPIPDDGYRPFLEVIFGDSAAVVEDRYPLSAYRSARQALAAIVSDREWAWPAEESDDLFARHVPTYSYEFTDRRAAPLFPLPGRPPGRRLPRLRARLPVRPPWPAQRPRPGPARPGQPDDPVLGPVHPRGRPQPPRPAPLAPVPPRCRHPARPGAGPGPDRALRPVRRAPAPVLEGARLTGRSLPLGARVSRASFHRRPTPAGNGHGLAPALQLRLPQRDHGCAVAEVLTRRGPDDDLARGAAGGTAPRTGRRRCRRARHRRGPGAQGVAGGHRGQGPVQQRDPGQRGDRPRGQITHRTVRTRR
jgi:hypothetical protein